MDRYLLALDVRLLQKIAAEVLRRRLLFLCGNQGGIAFS
jgi:hypothetical protein